MKKFILRLFELRVLGVRVLVAATIFSLFISTEVFAQSLCSLPGTPTTADVDNLLTQMGSDLKYAPGTSVEVDFGNLGGAQSASTSCGTGSDGFVSCKITYDPNYVNPVLSPITADHEDYHAYCSETDCPLNVNMLNTDGTGTGYSNTPAAPFHGQEIYTHYSDYVEFLNATQDAIDSGDQATATFTANWATMSMIDYNNQYSYTMTTIGLINSSILSHATDTALTSKGTSKDGNVSITYIAGSASNSVLGQPSVQISVADPGAPNGTGQITAEYQITDASVAPGGTINYANALQYLQSSLNSTTQYMAQLPPVLPAQDVYNLMASAGYAPANSYDTSALRNNFFTYDPATGTPSMQIGASSASFVPGPGVGANPSCPKNPPFEIVVTSTASTNCNMNFSAGSVNSSGLCDVVIGTTGFVNDPVNAPTVTTELPTITFALQSHAGSIALNLPTNLSKGVQYTYSYGSGYWLGSYIVESPFTYCLADSINNPGAYPASVISAGYKAVFTITDTGATGADYHGTAKIDLACPTINGVTVTGSTVDPKGTYDITF